MGQLSAASWSQPVLLQVSETAVEELRWLSGLPGWAYLLIVFPLVVLFARFVYRREKLTGSRFVRWSLTPISSDPGMRCLQHSGVGLNRLRSSAGGRRPGRLTGHVTTLRRGVVAGSTGCSGVEDHRAA